ncbi:MAG: hypothetical protein U5K56_13485 [Halioglobus sp.]|nr:hypothetical protein [Halioglobus sp.]
MEQFLAAAIRRLHADARSRRCIPQSLYQWLGGGEPLEALIWGNGHFMGWFMRAIAIALLYVFMSQLLPPVTTFFLLWLLPTYHIFEPYYTWLLLPALHVLLMNRYRSGWLWWLMQWLLTLALFLWRLDFGIASTVASLALAVLVAWHAARWSVLLESVAGAVVVAASVLTLYYLLSPSADIMRHLALIKAYMSNQIPLVSLSAYYREINYPFVLQYLALPALSALIFAWSLSIVLRRDSTGTGFVLDLLIAYLGAITLILSVRSLQRHSLISGDFNVYLHLVLVVLFMVRHLPAVTRLGSSTVLACFMMATYLLLPKAEDFLHRAMYHPPVVREYPAPLAEGTLPRWRPEQPRLRDNVDRYDDIVAFMSESLDEGQSFYDFSNATLLYALANVRLPVFIPQTAYQSSEIIQRNTVARLRGLREANRLPFVVFRQGNTGWDQLDGVDNALRSYLIAEFIYRHYKPCLRLDDFDIWVDRDRPDADDCIGALRNRSRVAADLAGRARPLAPGYLEQFIAFRSLPEIWARLDDVDESLSARPPLSVRPLDGQRIEISAAGEDIGCRGRACYLDLTVTASAETTATVGFLGDERMSFTIHPGKRRYRIRISALWHWHRADRIERLEIVADRPVDIDTAAIVIVE